VVNYKDVLADLRRKRLELEKTYKSKLAQLDSGIAAIEQVLALEQPSYVLVGSFAMPETTEEQTYAGLTVVAAAHRCLEIEGKHLTAPQIVERLKSGGFKSNAKVLRTSVYSAMFRDERFVRLKDGRWGLKSWQQ